MVAAGGVVSFLLVEYRFNGEGIEPVWIDALPPCRVGGWKIGGPRH